MKEGRLSFLALNGDQVMIKNATPLMLTLFVKRFSEQKELVQNQECRENAPSAKVPRLDLSIPNPLPTKSQTVRDRAVALSVSGYAIDSSTQRVSTSTAGATSTPNTSSENPTIAATKASNSVLGKTKVTLPLFKPLGQLLKNIGVNLAPTKPTVSRINACSRITNGKIIGETKGVFSPDQLAAFEKEKWQMVHQTLLEDPYLQWEVIQYCPSDALLVCKAWLDTVRAHRRTFKLNNLVKTFPSSDLIVKMLKASHFCVEVDLSALPNLDSASFASFCMGGSIPRHIRHLSLKGLKLNERYVKQLLARLVHLESIDFRDTSLTDEVFEGLGRRKNKLAAIAIGGTHIRSIPKHNNLKLLLDHSGKIRNNSDSTISIYDIKNDPAFNLNTMSSYGSNRSAAFDRQLLVEREETIGLERLIDEQSLSGMPCTTALTKILILRKCYNMCNSIQIGQSPSIHHILAAMDNLQVLDVSETGLSSDQVNLITSCSNLRIFKFLDAAELNTSALKALFEGLSQRLVCLEIGGFNANVSIVPSMIESLIEKCPLLKIVKFHNTNIDDQCVRIILEKSQSIVILDVSQSPHVTHNCLPDRDAKFIGKHTLRVVYGKGSGISEREFAYRMPRHSNFFLDLRHNFEWPTECLMAINHFIPEDFCDSLLK